LLRTGHAATHGHNGPAERIIPDKSDSKRSGALGWGIQPHRLRSKRKAPPVRAKPRKIEPLLRPALTLCGNVLSSDATLRVAAGLHRPVFLAGVRLLGERSAGGRGHKQRREDHN
jgi:hypothetical protein